MELIQKYIQGELTGEEMREFERRLRSDPGFAEEVEAAAVLYARYKVEKKQHWQALLESKGTEAPAKCPPQRISVISGSS